VVLRAGQKGSDDRFISISPLDVWRSKRQENQKQLLHKSLYDLGPYMGNLV